MANQSVLQKLAEAQKLLSESQRLLSEAMRESASITPASSKRVDAFGGNMPKPGLPGTNNTQSIFKRR